MILGAYLSETITAKLAFTIYQEITGRQKYLFVIYVLNKEVVLM
jgi:hypothetical protein